MKTILHFLTGLLLGALPGVAAAQNAPADRPPNIILIVADDLGYGDIGCFGQKKIQTPHIDRLAAGGMRFTHFYAGASVCAPSRSVLMTGQHGGRTRVRGNAPFSERRKQALLPEDVTLAEVLKKAGYATALVGKWGLGDHDTPGHPLDQGFDFFFGYLDQVHAHMYYPTWLWRNRDKVHLPNQVRPVPVGKDGVWGMGGITREAKVYSPALLLDEALRFIRQHQDRPFFLTFATPIPHANNEMAAELGDGAEVPDLGAYADKPWPKPEKGYAAMVSYLDTQVGALMAELEQRGLSHKTLVVFTSDNGPELQKYTGYDPAFFESSGPFRGHKRDLLDGGIRVPCIVRWPGHVAAGSQSAHVAYFGDLMATLAELAGEPAPDGTDSLSFASTLLGRPGEQPRRPWLYWEYHGGGRFAQAVLLKGRWKGLREGGPGHPLTLYDLDADPGETRDCAATHPEIAARCQKVLDREHHPSDRWPLPRR